MSDPDVGGFAITPKRLSFWLSLAGAAGLGFTVITTWNTQGFAIDTLKRDQLSLAESVKELKVVIKDLDASVVDLKVELASK